MSESLERSRMALSLRQRPMVLMQLIHKPPIWRRRGTSRPHELQRLRRMQSMRRNKVPTHNRHRARRAHRTMHQHARIRART